MNNQTVKLIGSERQTRSTSRIPISLGSRVCMILVTVVFRALQAFLKDSLVNGIDLLYHVLTVLTHL